MADKISPRQLLYTGLLIATIGLLYWHYYGMNQETKVPTQVQSRVYAFNDNINGGRSIGKLTYRGPNPKMTCSVIPSNTFAFCGLKIELGDGDAGLDLSDKQTLILDLEYTAEDRDTLLIYLNNEETKGNNSVQRANQLTMVPKLGRHRYELKLNQLFVPSWWIYYQGEGTSTETDISNVVSLQISTGDNTLKRDVSFTVHEMTFAGKWITGANLLRMIVFFWSFAAVLQVAYLLFQLQKTVKRSRAETRDLNRINSFLKVERDRMESLAKHDALTGCLNRNGLSDVLKAILQANKEQAEPASLILMDLDYFKKINDTYGHDQGDKVLTRVANLLKKNVRQSDRIARWGGEEFAIISPQTTLESARLLAENLRRCIAESALLPEHPMTASFGVAQLHTGDVETWFRSADQALYQSKGDGRNRVTLFSR